jgi:threonine dehydratase
MHLIGRRSVTEFNYRYSDASAAHIFLGLQTTSRAESLQLIDTLRAHGYPTIDLTEDELAKAHIRHLVGGRCPAARNGSRLRSRRCCRRPVGRSARRPAARPATRRPR